MSDNRSIGVFDSGLGGLTVLKALRAQFPHESMVYLGDTARLPYGTKSPEVVLEYTMSSASALMRLAELKLLVLACSTATAHALKVLQEKLPIPVVGVIEPSVLAVLQKPELQKVAILATAGTVASGAYEKALRQHGFQGQIQSLPCPLLVPLVEEGMTSGPIAESIVRYYLQQLNFKPDAIVLGCTHYPYLLSLFQQLADKKTLFIDSGPAAAAKIHFMASDHKEAETRYYVTDMPRNMKPFSEGPLERIDL